MNAIINLFVEFIEFILLGIVFLIACVYVYDRYIQRRHQLLINYPVIGRMRYLFEAIREPMRQYFANETFYESRDKIDWVYKAAKDVPNYSSFSVTQPFSGARFIIKHAAHVLNDDEVGDDFSVVFGAERPKPFVAASPIIRSAMSDGALSPEAVRAFSLGATFSHFTVNTGEGGLTSNHLYTHKPDPKHSEYLEIIPSKAYAEFFFNIVAALFNRAMAIKLYRKLLLNKKTRNTYIYEPDTHILFRMNWNAPLHAFPKEVPTDVPDMIFQLSSGLYGVRDANGAFDPERYQKIMRFCRMSEIKIAQGAKQTGGKLAGSKVNADVAYYRGVEEGKDLFSPNRFPFAHDDEALLDFIEELQRLSQKPVGIKIVISDGHANDPFLEACKRRKEAGRSIPDFITVDSGEGGSATAPLELMESVGLTTHNALFVLDNALKKHQLREDIKIIASGKILTPDDVIITLAMGADAVGIARGFMMSGGCIRARMCSGYGSHVCPVGMATQDPKKRASYLVVKQAHEIANYHKNLLKGIKTVLAVMGNKSIHDLKRSQLTFKNRSGEIFFDIDKYFHHKLHV